MKKTLDNFVTNCLFQTLCQIMEESLKKSLHSKAIDLALANFWEKHSTKRAGEFANFVTEEGLDCKIIMIHSIDLFTLNFFKNSKSFEKAKYNDDEKVKTFIKLLQEAQREFLKTNNDGKKLAEELAAKEEKTPGIMTLDQEIINDCYLQMARRAMLKTEVNQYTEKETDQNPILIFPRSEQA